MERERAGKQKKPRSKEDELSLKRWGNLHQATWASELQKVRPSEKREIGPGRDHHGQGMK